MKLVKCKKNEEIAVLTTYRSWFHLEAVALYQWGVAVRDGKQEFYLPWEKVNVIVKHPRDSKENSGNRGGRE